MVTKPQDRIACDSSERVPDHMPAVACNPDDGCFSLKGHKPKSTVFSSVHPVSWHVNIHDITATGATEISKHMLDTCSQDMSEVTARKILSEDLGGESQNANKLQTHDGRFCLQTID